MFQKSSEKGFTIIEVVLVLAIAALIFLIVFLAVPTLQRSQRDTQRRSDVGRLHSAVTSWSSSRQGQIPTTTDMNAGWIFKYVRASKAEEKFEDPRGNTSVSGPAGTPQYNIQADGTGTNTPPTYSQTDNAMHYRPGQRCHNNGTTATEAGPRSFAVIIALESGDFYCQNN